MKTKVFKIPTSRRVDFIDVTPFIISSVEESGIDGGIAHVLLKKTSAALAIQEFEPNLLEDFEKFLSQFASDDMEAPIFKHNQMWRRPDVPEDEPKNADAHIKSLFMGSSVVIPVVDGVADFGTWQRAILVEMDGPRERVLTIMTQGDTMQEGLAQYISEKAEVVNKAMEPYIDGRWEGNMLEVSRYLTKGGKRLRGSLAIMMCEALGGDPDKALDAAVAVEMIHAASLARDDIQDGDETRRDSMSAWVMYGIRKAMAMADITIPHAISMLRKYGREAVYTALDSWKQVGVGQAKDLFVSTFRGKGIYEEIIIGKTGALFGLATTLGAISAEADGDLKKDAALFGRNLGAAFQVMDDVADLRAGKSVPDSFTVWLGNDDPEDRIEEMIAELREVSKRFPDSEHRKYLDELPEYAYQAMMAEVDVAKEPEAAVEEEEIGVALGPDDWTWSRENQRWEPGVATDA